MSEHKLPWNPWSTFGVAASAWLDAAKSTQDTIARTLDQAAHANGDTVEWISFQVPVPGPSLLIDEEQMRESFHRLADQNLRQWELAANFLQALPGWSNWPSRTPGTMMTDWFDRMRRASETMMPANDSAMPGQGFSPQTFWAAASQAATAASTAAAQVPSGPELLDAANGKPDDLTRIKGIGGKLSQLLNELGIYHFSQIAAWSEADGEWIDDKLAFKGRVARENWIAQAADLAAAQAA